MNQTIKGTTLSAILFFGTYCSHSPLTPGEFEAYEEDSSLTTESDPQPQKWDNHSAIETDTNPQGWDSSNCAHITASGDCAHPTGAKK